MIFYLQEIDELISGVLSSEDEAVIELELAQLISENTDVPVFPDIPKEILTGKLIFLFRVA